MKPIIFIGILMTSFMSIAQNENPKTPKIAVVIDKGEAADLGEVKLTFKQVLEDSRCPKGVTCVWAGRVKVLVEISEEGKEPLEKEVIIGQTRPNEEDNRKVFTDGEYYVEVVAVSPYPEKDKPKGPYQLKVCEYNKGD